VDDATLDHDQVEARWHRTPDVGVGIVTGAVSQLAVVDVDPRNGEGLTDLEREHGRLPDSPTVVTPGGGHHAYLRLPPGVEVPCRVSLYPGLDLKGARGFVVAPPSLHPNGGRYAWAQGLGLDDVPIAVCPQALLRLASERTDPARDAYEPSGQARSMLSKRVRLLVLHNPRVRRRFLRDPSGLSDASASGVDLSLAILLAQNGTPGDQIEAALRASWAEAGIRRVKPASYFEATIGKALATGRAGRRSA